MFQGFWPQDHNICRAAFSEQQPSHVNLCRFLVNIQCFYHLSKLKAIKLTLRPRMPHPHPHPLRDKPRMLDLSVNFQTPNAASMWFSGLLQFQPFFGLFLWLLDFKTKFVKFYTKFWIKEVKFLASRCTNLLLRSKPVQRNCLSFFKNFKKQCGL